jgi:pilus assembly protein Flp/PilA
MFHWVTESPSRVARMNLLADFLCDDSAATAIEYALIAGGIAVVIVAAVGAVGTNLKPIFISAAAGLVAP